MRILLLFLLVLGSVACKKKTYYIKSIENRTDNELFVGVYRTVILPEEEFFSLQPGEVRTYTELEEDGLQGKAPDCLDGVDSIRIIFKDQYGSVYPIRMDYASDQSWETNKAEPSNFIEYSCTLVVDSSHIYSPSGE